MIKFKYFDMKDDKAINSHMSEFILAKGSSVFMSNGTILIPYEDGLLPNKDQEVLTLLELKNEMWRQREILLHSQNVLQVQVDGATAKKKEVEDSLDVTPKDKEALKLNRQKKDEAVRLDNVIAQHNATINNNKAELTRLDANLTVFNNKIVEIKAR